MMLALVQIVCVILSYLIIIIQNIKDFHLRKLKERERESVCVFVCKCFFPLLFKLSIGF